MKMSIRKKLIFALATMIGIPILVVFISGNSFNSEPSGTMILIMLLIVSYIMVAVMVSRFVVRHLLTPLNELSEAMKKIAKGELDFTVKYRNSDEMGEFCASFDSMRMQLKESLKKQTLLEKSRKELIASISHDLRTPISSIRGYVEGLEDGIVHDKERFNRYIAVIKNKTESLDNQIESLFQFSQLELNNSMFKLCKRNSAELLEAILNPYELEFANYDIRLEIVRPFPKVEVLANESSLSQVFDNLIANAKRYANDNGVITIQTNAKEQSLTVSISDNGIGISPEDLPHVFEHFYRAEKSRSRYYGGAGLGLAICKRIIESHGGQIWVESSPNEWTTFYFTLPYYYQSTSLQRQ